MRGTVKYGKARAGFHLLAVFFQVVEDLEFDLLLKEKGGNKSKFIKKLQEVSPLNKTRKDLYNSFHQYLRESAAFAIHDVVKLIVVV